MISFIIAQLLIVPLLAVKNENSFGFTSCSKSYNKYSATNDLMTLTYFKKNEMYQCKIQGTGLFGNEYICNINSSSTNKCISSDNNNNMNGLQIDIPYNPLVKEDDVCVDNLIINGKIIDIDDNSHWIGDDKGGIMKNYRYFDFGSNYDSSNITSTVSGLIVDGQPNCYVYIICIYVPIISDMYTHFNFYRY